MRLLEYEAKELLARHGAAIPRGAVLRAAPLQWTLPTVLKAQVPTGGRGKAGGVRIVSESRSALAALQQLLSQPTCGYQATAVLAEEVLHAAKEFYVACAVDRDARGIILLANTNGGVEVETAEGFWRRSLTAEPDEHTARDLAAYLGVPELQEAIWRVARTLWQTLIAEDALLVEVNPLVLTVDQKLVCADAKIVLDDAATFRHAWQFAAPATSSNYVVLHSEGNVAAMANGAGLGMATVDAIATAGAVPANFLDVGGGSSVSEMKAALQRLADLPRVKAIVINIFAGITQCDQVAQAILAAQQEVADLPPLFIRLSGTNEQEGQALLKAAGIATLPTLAACVSAAVNEVDAHV